ncbi:MAG: hypothetical protein HQM10_21105 [Candidatus Riflebacteria bacterium]|nr:hypothetical protein [Candidatus Riflebacteria bacterium]
MLEKYLKITLILLLMGVYSQKVLYPMYLEQKKDRFELLKLAANIERFRSIDKFEEKKRLERKDQILRESFIELRKILPLFEDGNNELLKKIDKIRLDISGKWIVKPSSVFNQKDKVISWPVQIEFEGEFADSLKILAKLETEENLVKITSSTLRKIPGKSSVKLELTVEMLFWSTRSLDGKI